jgi:6-phosphogluconolactonase (cycloisomerase 2 family)
MKLSTNSMQGLVRSLQLAIVAMLVCSLVSCGSQSSGGASDSTTSSTSTVGSSSSSSGIAPPSSSTYLYVANGVEDNPNDSPSVKTNDVTGIGFQPVTVAVPGGVTIDTQVMAALAGSPYSAGNETVSVAVHPSNKFLFAANAAGPLGNGGTGLPVGSGNISAFSIDATTGSLTELGGSPYALRPLAGAPSSPPSPGYLAVDPTGKFLYAACNAICLGTISAYAIGSDGSLTEVAGSPYYSDPNVTLQTGGYAAPFEIAIDPTGRFLYVTNNGSSRIGAFTIDGTSGALTPIAGSPFDTGFPNSIHQSTSPGHYPTGIAIDASGKYLYVANEGAHWIYDQTGNVIGSSQTSSVSVYTIDANTGALTLIDELPSGAEPEAIALEPTGHCAFVANQYDNTIETFSIDQTTGDLTHVDQMSMTGIPAATLNYIGIAPALGGRLFATSGGDTQSGIAPALLEFEVVLNPCGLLWARQQFPLPPGPSVYSTAPSLAVTH